MTMMAKGAHEGRDSECDVKPEGVCFSLNALFDLSLVSCSVLCETPFLI